MLVVGDALPLQAVQDLALRLGGPASETRVAAMALEGQAVLISAVSSRPSSLAKVLDRLWALAATDEGLGSSDPRSGSASEAVRDQRHSA